MNSNGDQGPAWMSDAFLERLITDVRYDIGNVALYGADSAYHRETPQLKVILEGFKAAREKESKGKS